MLMVEGKSLYQEFKGFEEELQKHDDTITNLEITLEKNYSNHNQDQKIMVGGKCTWQKEL
jgi:ABC-type uncharacterized transport system substrate-binding protein